MRTEGQPPVDLQVDRPHGARVYDYLLGGKTNFAADREQAEKVLESIPSVRVARPQSGLRALSPGRAGRTTPCRRSAIPGRRPRGGPT
ncbi:hypothetical protein G4Z16_02610 [Streptomyces bathyalis]|uniref:Uncharacterized protein n=2 Tax=Streptomyces bathyalis TaxID=2710756 RepID=A0A7T1TC98_9ACTN|nr:SAM-dependent methyltransferase [Streptomyces bathyalis]QPP10352.1 hypothetical protein G4Z16_02610 [Streptomyces bathyalis]